jgi:hypothetical protein
LEEKIILFVVILTLYDARQSVIYNTLLHAIL